MVSQPPSPNRLWPRCFLIIIVIVILIFLWCWFLPSWCPLCKPCEEIDCSDCPEEGEAVAQIIVDDTRATSWMVASNDDVDSAIIGTIEVCQPATEDAPSSPWAPCKGYAEVKAHGVMFQFGSLHGEEGYLSSLKKVELIKANDPDSYDLTDPNTIETINLEPGQFDWLDASPYSECILDPYYAYAMFINEHVKLSCDEWNADREFVMTDCERNRSIHSSLKADIGLMTYWSGINGYDLAAERNDWDLYPSYSFALHDPIHVDHWLDGCFVERYPNVVRIVAYFDDHGDEPGSIMDDPPTDGGVHTFP